VLVGLPHAERVQLCIALDAVRWAAGHEGTALALNLKYLLARAKRKGLAFTSRPRPARA
jgi:hypothetical protein